MKLGPKVGVPKPGVGGCTPVWRTTWFVADPKRGRGVGIGGPLAWSGTPQKREGSMGAWGGGGGGARLWSVYSMRGEDNYLMCSLFSILWPAWGENMTGKMHTNGSDPWTQWQEFHLLEKSNINRGHVFMAKKKKTQGHTAWQTTGADKQKQSVVVLHKWSMCSCP